MKNPTPIQAGERTLPQFKQVAVTKSGLARIPSAKEGDVFTVKHFTEGGHGDYFCAHALDTDGNVWSLGEGDWTPVASGGATLSAHTKGPWSVGSNLLSGLPHIRTSTADICDLSGRNHAANARLIAAAPELLEALRAFAEPHEMGDNYVKFHPRLIQAARAAIAKAEGAE